MNSKEYMEQTEQYVLHTYNRFPVVLKEGHGVYLTDVDGNDYLDFGAGIAVFALGYGNRAYNDALKAQVDQIIHTSNLYYHIPCDQGCAEVCVFEGRRHGTRDYCDAPFLPRTEHRRTVRDRQPTLSGGIPATYGGRQICRF